MSDEEKKMLNVDNPEDSDTWCIKCSDDEKYEITSQDMIELYGQLSRGEPFELEWKCPGRRPPTPEKKEEEQDMDTDLKQESSEQQQCVFLIFNHFLIFFPKFLIPSGLHSIFITKRPTNWWGSVKRDVTHPTTTVGYS